VCHGVESLGKTGRPAQVDLDSPHRDVLVNPDVEEAPMKKEGGLGGARPDPPKKTGKKR
jgi:hypothetical protein